MYLVIIISRSYRLKSFWFSFPPHKRIKDKTNKLLPVVCYAGSVLALINRLRRGHLRKLYPCYSVYTHSLTTTDTGSILPCTVANRSGISPSHNSIRCRSVSKGLSTTLELKHLDFGKPPKNYLTLDLIEDWSNL